MKKFFGPLVMIFAFMLLITGCGGSSTSTPAVVDDGGGSAGGDGTGGDTGGGTGGDTGGDTGGGSTNVYSGAAKISGSIDLDSLSSQDSAALGKAAAGKPGAPFSKALLAADATMNAIVKLYVVGADGELEDTGIECTLTQDADGNVDYECDGVKDGVNYVVKYLKVTTDGKALELKANATVEEGATASIQDVSPKTSVVVESLVNAILDATEGVDIDQTVVNNIIDAVKVVIETLVDAGIIQIPSMIVDVQGSTVEEVLAEDVVNEDVSNTAGQVLADDSVDVELSVVKTETQAAQFDLLDAGTDAAKAALIDRVFKEMLGGDDIPGFMLQFFQDIYIEGKTIDVNALIGAITTGLSFRPDLTETPTITVTGGIAAFNASMSELYALLEKKDAGALTPDDPSDDLTDVEKRALSEIPPVMPGLFPIAEKTTWTAVNTGSILNVPQAIAFTIYFVDVYISEAFEALNVDASYAVTENTDGSVEYDKEEPFDFDPMSPGSLLDALGFFEIIQANPDKYAGIDIFDLWLYPGRIWLESTGQDTDALNAGACWMNVADMFSETAVDFSGATVTLTYPTTSGGRTTIELVSQASLWGGPADVWNNCWVLDPWMEANALADSASTDPVEPNPARIISDFTSGTYTVSVTYGGNTVTKDFEKKVITGMTDKYPTLISPLGMPQWPGENPSPEEQAAFDAAWVEYNNAGMTRYAANVDADGNEPGLDANGDPIPATHAKVTIKWKAPEVTLPDGVKMAFSLDVGKGGCDPNNTDPATSCIWEPIWNSWERNKRLYVTSFTLPTPIPKQDPTDPYRYFVNVGVEFIDKSTGETLGSGGWANAEFMVSDPLDTTQPFDIVGLTDSVVVKDASTGDPVDSIVRATLDLKAALVSEFESCDPDLIINPCTRTTTVLQVTDVATDGSYTLSPTIADFLDNAGTWFNIVIFLDENPADNDLNLDENGYFAEPTAWPDWEQGNVWFDTWGGSLRVGQETCTTATDGTRECEYKDTVIIGGETVDGPKFIFEYWPPVTP